MPGVRDEFRPPNQERFDAVMAMRAKLMPDADIVRQVAEQFGCHQNTVRNDIRRLDEMMVEQDEKKRETRRAVLVYQMGLAAQQVLVEAQTAEDPKARAINWRTLFDSYFGRLGAWYGLSDETAAKTEILRMKWLEKLPPQELDAMIKTEVDKAIESMPVDELEQRVKRKRGE